MRTCSLCPNKHHSKGFCQHHYNLNYWNEHKVQVPNAKANRARYVRTPKGLFKGMRELSAKRGIAIEISLEQFTDLRKRPCHYCGGELSEAGYSMDRRDNALAYTAGNTVPCCFDCNETKSNKLTEAEMLAVVAFRSEANIAERMIGSC